MNLTVDASVFVAALQRAEPRNQEAIRFLAQVELLGHAIQCPATVLVEVSCAVARATRDPVRGRIAMQAVRELPFLRLMEISETFAVSSGEIGAGLFLRSGDSFYPAVALAMSAILITYDVEMRERSLALVPVRTPSEWLAEQAG